MVSLSNWIIELENIYNEIKAYHKNVQGLSGKDFSKQRVTIRDQIDTLPKLLQDINLSVVKLEKAKVDGDLQTSINEQMKIINNRVRPKQEELEKLIIEINSKEKNRGDYNSTSYNDANQNELELTEKNLAKQNPINDIKFQKAVIDSREKDLSEVHKVSSQVKDITIAMNETLIQQGLQINSIEEHVVDSRNNSVMADDEIHKASLAMSGEKKRILILLVLIILIIIIMVIVIVKNS